MFRRTNGVLAATALACALALGVTACGGGSSTSSTTPQSGVKARTIGYVDIVAAGAMQKRWYNYFTLGAAKLGWTVKLADANGDPTVALKDAENFINQGVDALAVSCVETGGLRSALDDAAAKGIPVVAVGCAEPPPTTAWSGIYAEDDLGLAQALANFLLKQIGPGTEVGILADAALLVGRLRTDLIKSELLSSGINVVANTVVPLTDIVHGSTVATSNILNSHPKVKAIICIFDFFAGPAITAVQQAGKQGSVNVYSFYADQVNLPLMLAPGSPLKGLVDGPVEQVSLVALDQLLKHFQNAAKLDPNAAQGMNVPFKVFTPQDHPDFVTGYITPWDFNTYAKPWFDKWNQAYGLNLTTG